MNQSSVDYSPFFFFNPLPCIIYDLETFKIFDVNKASEILYGYTKEEFITLTLHNICLENDYPHLFTVHQNLQKLSESHFTNSFTHKTKLGELKPIEITGQIAYFSGRNCVMAICKEKTEHEKEKLDVGRLLDSSLDVFCTIDENGFFEYVSASALNLWGYHPEELIGKPYQNFILEEDLQNTIETEGSVLSGKNLTSFINRYKKKDGGVALNSWSVTWNENTKQLFCVARDAREIISKEEEILASEQRFKALVQEGSDLIGILDLEGNYLYVSPTSTSVLGISPEEFMGRNAFEFIHQDDASRILESIQKTAIENKVVLEPFRFQNHKKEWRWIETVFTNMLDHPAVRGIVANSRDITERIEERHKLKLLESVIINTKDAILITEAEPLDDPGPRIIYVNEAFTKMTGYTAAEVIGKSPRILQGPNSSKEELQKLSHALRNWEPYEITTINYKKNGEEFWINFTVTPVANEEGWYTHWIAIERDVTEQKTKELEKELLAEISSNFNVESDLENSLNKLCKSISGYGNFDLVEVWTPNLVKNQMNRYSHYLASAEDEIFYTYNSELSTVKKHEGLVGKVWAEGTQLLWHDLDQNNEFLRIDTAEKIGLKAVFGIPLTFQDEIVGVLKVGTKQEADYLDKFIQLFKRLEEYLGSELNRKKLENDLSNLLDSIPDIICLLDNTGNFLKINTAGCNLLGYSKEYILNHSFDDFVYQREGGTFTKELNQKNETVFKFENRFVTKSGETIWLSWYCNDALKDGVYATAKNITEEKNLRELNSQTRNLAKIGSWELDIASQKVYWSDEIYQILETSPTSFTPSLESTNTLYRVDFQQMVGEKIENCIEKGEPFDFEAVLITTKKNEKWIRAIGNAEFVDGASKRIFGCIQDITSHKNTENRLSLFSENLPGVIFQYIIYPDGTDCFKYISGAVEQLWGFTAQEAMEDSNVIWEQVKLGGKMEELQASIINSVQTKSKWNCRIHYVMPSGELRTNLGIGTPSFLADGSVLFHSIVLDITQEVKNEKMLEETAKIAQIGSWEMDLLNEDSNSMNWSPMIFEILELEDNYNPTLTGGIEFHIGESKERIQKALELLITEGIEFDEEILLRTAKGNERWSRAIGKCEIVNNKRTRIYGSYQDIHGLKLTEQNLKNAYEEKNKILESIGDAFCAVDNNWIVTYWNKEAEIILGRKKEEIVGKHLWEEYSDVVDTEFYRQYHKAIETREASYFESYYPAVNKWLEVAAYPAEEGLSVYFKDITQRRESDLELLKANERFEKVTEATNDAIWDWDLVNQVYTPSKAIERFFGKEVSKSFDDNQLWKDGFHPEDLPKIQESIYEAIADPLCSRWELEYRIVNTSGKTLYIIDRGVIIRDLEGNATRMVGAMSDITEQKQMTMQLGELNTVLQHHATELKRSNEELEQFAFIASHDLQEPLRMISSFMDILKRKYGDQLDQKANQYIYFASDGAKRMKQIILDLMEYSRTNRPTEGIEEVNINELVSDFSQLRRKLILEKSAVIRAENLPTLLIYKAAITQIFHCLLDNALKYSKTGTATVIEINVVESEIEWLFSIKDNGIGIDSKYFDKIFVIFQRLHGREKFTGTGMGLSITKRLVEFLGGKIWLESEVGRGTEFYFKIPKLKQNEYQEHETQSHSLGGG